MVEEISEPDRGEEGAGRTVLVTGASSGIGRSMAELAAAKGYRVLAVARRRERLEELAERAHERWDGTIVSVPADLSSPGGIEAVVEHPDVAAGRVDLLVNNAGNSYLGRFDEVPWQIHSERMHLMWIASWRLCHATLPGMVQRGWGRVLNLSSIGGMFTGFPTDVPYGAIKAMIVNFSEGLDAEYRHLGVRSTVTIPGPTATEIFTTPGSAADVARDGLFNRFQMTPAQVARESYEACLAGRPFVVPGPSNKALVGVLDHAPRPLTRRLSQRLCTLMEE